ncbi:uncharacterized protein LOC134498064 [Candoia aspera]|uniref:uncharacterized protein LOC134498064 n=1 Tax=Candoia aspera TaxID=51853 RepID=UPI002FD7C198
MANQNHIDEGSLKLPRLTENNFIQWKKCLEAIFDLKEILNCIEKEKPTGTTEEAKASVKTWEKQNKLAVAIILNSILDVQMVHVKKGNTAAQILENLELSYGFASKRSHHAWVRDLFKLKLVSKTDCNSHVTEFLTIIEKLELTEYPMQEEQKVCYFLGSLGPKFETFVTLMDGKTDLTLRKVIAHLREECVERRQESPTRNAKANDSNYMSKFQAKAKATPKKIMCFNCNKEGYIAKACKAPKSQKFPTYKQPNKRKGKNEGSILLQEKSLTVNNCDAKQMDYRFWSL